MAPYSGLASYTTLAVPSPASTSPGPAATSRDSTPTSPGRAQSAAMPPFPSSQATATASASGTSAPEFHREMDDGRITASSGGSASGASARSRW